MRALTCGFNRFNQCLVAPEKAKPVLDSCTISETQGTVVASSWCQTISEDGSGAALLSGFDPRTSSRSALSPLGIPVGQAATFLGQDEFLAYLDRDGVIRDLFSLRQTSGHDPIRCAVVSGNGQLLLARGLDKLELWPSVEALFDEQPAPEPARHRLTPGLTVTALAAGAGHFLILAAPGGPTGGSSAVFAFGDNRFGQLGLPRSPAASSTYVDAPQRVKELDAAGVTSIAAGDLHSVARLRLPRKRTR